MEAPSHDGSILDGPSSVGDALNGKDLPSQISSNSFLGISVMNMNMKWGWPTALTFGKGAKKQPELPENKQELVQSKEKSTNEGNRVLDTPIPSAVAQGLDQGALMDAISSDSSGAVVSCVADEHFTQPLGDQKTQSSIPPLKEIFEKDRDIQTTGVDASCVNYDAESTSVTSVVDAAVPQLPPVFSSVIVHLATLNNSHLTTRQKVYYIIVSTSKHNIDIDQ